ncbi:transporter substrate-binding domain-containing protein [Pseudomonas sp. CrR25]|nr:transporter substrate-binding domain-containing protein [Pseudomonas sp. CrR25]
MRALPRHLVMAALLWAAHPASGAAEEIVLVSPAYWCPFSCTAGSAQEGFTVDIIRWIFARHAIDVRLVNGNYSRALLEVRSGRYTATPSSLKSEAPDFTYPEKAISFNRFCFYTRAEDDWRYTGTSTLHGRQVGIIQHYSYGTSLDALIRTQAEIFRNHAGNDLTQRLIKQLQLKRLDTFIEEEHLVRYALLQHPHYAVRQAGCERGELAYMAISPNHPRRDAYARLFSEGMREIRRNGVLQQILSAYGLNDWQR